MMYLDFSCRDLGISGPYANGAINLAIVPNSNPPLPITISSVNSVTPINQQYFIDNSGGLDTIADADGMTTVLTGKYCSSVVKLIILNC